MPRKPEPKLTKKQLRELAKQKKLEEERRIREEQERLIAEEKRQREEELERIRQAELKYRQEEASRLKIEEQEYLSFFIAFMHNKEKVSKSFRESLEWKHYVNCQEIYSVEKESDVNMVITNLREKRISDEKSLNEMLDMIDQVLEFVTKINVKILDLISSSTTSAVPRYVDDRRRIFKTVRQKLKQVHCYILQTVENLVDKKLTDLRKNQVEINSKPGKGLELKPEVQIGYSRANFAVGYWIMAFENSGIKPTPINFKELNAMSDVPKAFFSKKLAMFAVKFNSNFLDVHKIGSISDLESRLKTYGPTLFNPLVSLPLNGFLEVGCLDLLSESKKIGDFDIKRMLTVKESLKRMSIPTVEGTTSNFKIYVFPDALTTLEEPVSLNMFYYDRAKKIWTKENVASVKSDYNEELKKDEVVASVPMMAPFILSDSLSSHLPYRSFKVGKMENGNIKMTLETTKSVLKFEVGQGYVKLIHSTSENLAQLFNVEMRPHEMLFKLAECGILLVPHLLHYLHGFKDFEFINTVAKTNNCPVEPQQDAPETPKEFPQDDQTDPEQGGDLKPLEELHQESKNEAVRVMKLLVNGYKDLGVDEYCRNEVTRHALRFSMRLSKWNSECGAENVVLKIREHYSADAKTNPAQMGGWKTVLMSKNKCEILAIDEKSKQFSAKRKDDTVSHLNLFLLVKQYPQLFNYYTYSDEFSDSDLLVIETLERFLKPTMLFAFSG